MKKNVMILAVVIAALGMTSIPAGFVNATGQKWSNVVYPRVYIEGIDVSGRNLSEVENLIYEKCEQPLLSKKIQVDISGKIYELDYKKLEAHYNTSEVVRKVFDYEKEVGIFKRYFPFKSAEKKEFKLDLAFNPKLIDELVETVEKDLNKGAVNACISIIKGDIKITPEINGIKLEKDKLKQEIINRINEGDSVESIKITAPMEEVKANITSEKLAVINVKISSFNTSFWGSTAERINNINMATKAINGTLLMPGESFSFNDTVGKRTSARGYKDAGVIIDDKIEPAMGGGICQVSSTLYNAVLRSGLKAVERRNHTLPLGYISKGLDATVDYGNIDLKFKNTMEAPIYIEGYTENKKVYFNFYSSKDLTKRSYELVTEVTETIKPTVKYIDDPNREEGETEVVKKASEGYKVKTYKKTFEDGKLISTELISSDYYRPVNEEIIRGTKKV